MDNDEVYFLIFASNFGSLNQIRQLAGQTVIYGMGTIIPRLLNYLLLTPFYTRIFQQGEYGIVTELYAYVAFLFVLLTYGMETAFFRFYEKQENKNQVYSTSLASLFITSSLFIILVLAFAGPIATFVQYQDHVEYIIYFAIIIGIDAFLAIPFARLRQKNKALKFAIIKIINVLTNIGFNFFFFLVCPRIYANNPDSLLLSAYDPSIGVGYAFISNLLASIITLILLVPEIWSATARVSLKLLKQMLSYAFPLLIVGIAGMVNEVSDKLLFKFLLTVPATIEDSKEYVLSQLGIYGANYKLAVLMTLFIQMFRYAAEPFFFSHARETDSRKLYADVMKYFIIFCLVIFLAVTLYLDIFKFFIGADFREGLHIVPIVLIANLLLGVFFNLSIWYKLNDLTRFGAYIALVGATITIILNVLLVPVMGYTGAAWAHFFCYLVMVLISYFLGRKYYPVPYDMRRIFIYFTLAMAFFVIEKVVEWPGQYLMWIANSMMFLAFIVTVVLMEKNVYRKSFQ
jgi:O-antigen/teichoic acid export membrane protein